MAQAPLEPIFKTTTDRRLRARCPAVWMASRGRKRRAIAPMVDDYARLQQFRKRLAKLFGVKSAQQKRFSDHRASIDITFTGSPQTLADLISTTVFPDLQVRVTRFTSDQLEVEVR